MTIPDFEVLLSFLACWICTSYSQPGATRLVTYLPSHIQSAQVEDCCSSAFVKEFLVGETVSSEEDFVDDCLHCF